MLTRHFLEGQEAPPQPREFLLLSSGHLAAAGRLYVPAYKLSSSHVGKGYFSQMPVPCVSNPTGGWSLAAAALMLWLWGCQDVAGEHFSS